MIELLRKSKIFIFLIYSFEINWAVGWQKIILYPLLIRNFKKCFNGKIESKLLSSSLLYSFSLSSLSWAAEIDLFSMDHWHMSHESNLQATQHFSTNAAAAANFSFTLLLTRERKWISIFPRLIVQFRCYAMFTPCSRFRFLLVPPVFYLSIPNIWHYWPLHCTCIELDLIIFLLDGVFETTFFC